MGGVGKTRLAVEAAARLQGDPADGMAFVDLSPIRDGKAVLSAVGQVLGATETDGQPILENLVATLQGTNVLLVLDNFEHVLDAAPAVSNLLRRCPRLKVLVTSRGLLRVSGEHTFNVTPLALPDPATEPVPHDLQAVDSVRLFVDRAEAAIPGFRVTEENASAIAAICFRLEGLPLAIELAAARSNQFSPNAMLRQLQDRFRFLSGGPRDQPARLRTMRDAVSWSYGLLGAQEQAVCRRLAVFVGGFGLEVAYLVAEAPGVSEGDVSETIASLVDMSLVRSLGDIRGSARFDILETIREYVLERLVESGELQAVKERHADAYLALAERGGVDKDGQDPEASLDRLEIERGNLRAAFDWNVGRGDTEPASRLAFALRDLWLNRGWVGEGRLWLSRLLAPPGQLTAEIRSEVLILAHDLALVQGDAGSGRAFEEEILSLLEEHDQPLSFCHALSFLTHQSRGLNEAEQGRLLILCERSLKDARAQGETGLIALLLFDLASVLESRGDFREAKTVLQEALQLVRGVGDFECQVEILCRLSGCTDDHDEAMTFYREAEDLVLKSDGDEISDAIFWERFWFARATAVVRRSAEDFQRVTQLLEGRLAFARRQGHPGFVIARYLHELSGVAFLRHDYQAASDAWEEELKIWTMLENPEEVTQIKLALAKTADLLGDHSRAEEILRQLLLSARTADDKPLAVCALSDLGELLCRGGSHDEAVVLLEEALALSLQNGLFRETIVVLRGLRKVAQARGEQVSASPIVRAELELLERYAITFRADQLLTVAARWRRDRDEHDLAAAHKARARGLWTELASYVRSAANVEGVGRVTPKSDYAPLVATLRTEVSLLLEDAENAETPELAVAMNVRLGDLARRLGDRPLAALLLEDALSQIHRSFPVGRNTATINDVSRELQREELKVDVLVALGELAQDQANPSQAEKLYREGMTVEVPGMTPLGSVIGLASIAAEGGRLEEAGLATAALEALEEAEEVAIESQPFADRYVRTVVSVHSELAPERLQEIWSAGRRLSLEQLVAEFSDSHLLDACSLTSQEPHGINDLHGLTPREVEVLRQVAKGHPDQQIAEELFISASTVKKHVSNIYDKLSLHNRNRVELTLFARDIGLA
jgi:predicted ATPase/DNA-binding CsgD family transcriptional regulator